MATFGGLSKYEYPSCLRLKIETKLIYYFFFTFPIPSIIIQLPQSTQFVINHINVIIRQLLHIPALTDPSSQVHICIENRLTFLSAPVNSRTATNSSMCGSWSMGLCTENCGILYFKFYNLKIFL